MGKFSYLSKKYIYVFSILIILVLLLILSFSEGSGHIGIHYEHCNDKQY